VFVLVRATVNAPLVRITRTGTCTGTSVNVECSLIMW